MHALKRIARPPARDDWQREGPRVPSRTRDSVDANSETSFPASDPPCWTPVARIGAPGPGDCPRPPRDPWES